MAEAAAKFDSGPVPVDELTRIIFRGGQGAFLARQQTLKQKRGRMRPPKVLRKYTLMFLAGALRERDPKHSMFLVARACEAWAAWTSTWPPILLLYGPATRLKPDESDEEWLRRNPPGGKLEKEWLRKNRRTKALPHPPSKAGIAAGMVGLDLPGDPFSDRALRYLVGAVRKRLPGAVREVADDALPLVSIKGEIGLALKTLALGESPPVVVGRAVAGGLDHVPHAAARNAQDHDEEARRWKGRGVGEGTGGNAEGKAKLLVGLELAAPRSKDPHAEDLLPDEMLSVPEWGKAWPSPLEILLAVETDPAVIAIKKAEAEYGRLRKLAEQFRPASKEHKNLMRQAQRIRRDGFDRLGIPTGGPSKKKPQNK